MPPIAILWVPTFELVCSSSSGLTFTRVYMWGGGGELCVELCAGSWGELCGVGELCKGNCVGSYVGRWVGLRGGTGWVGGWRCAKELCEGACTPVTRWSSHTHTIASSTPSTRGIPHYPLSHPPLPSVPAHSSSQVAHCRVCPPHPLHAPVLVLHLAVYPASSTQGRVGSLTGCHTVHRHSAI